MTMSFRGQDNEFKNLGYQDLLKIIEDNRFDDRPILHFYEDFNLIRSLRYEDIWQESQQVAQLLLGQAHTNFANDLFKTKNESNTEGDLVLISVVNSPEFVFAFFGCLLAGCIPVPVATREHLGRSEYIDILSGVLHMTESAQVLTDRISVETIKDLQSSFPNLKIHQMPQLNLFREVKTLKTSIQNRFEKEDLCFIQFSSGSTSQPKGVEITHGACLANLSQIRQGMDVKDSDILVSWLPFFHDMGWIGAVLGPLFNQVPAHLMSPVDFLRAPEKFLQLVSKVNGTLLLGPDFMYRFLAKNRPSINSKNINLKSIRLALTGAEPISKETCDRFINSFSDLGFRAEALMPVYGLAENCLGVSFSPQGKKINSISVQSDDLAQGKIELNTDFSQRTKETGNKSKQNYTEIVSCGYPLKGIKVEIFSEDGQTLPENRIGEICFQSPAQTRGYYRSPDLNQEQFRSGWFRTGDMGFLRQGELYIVGRQKDTIIRNGKKYHATDIEKKVSSQLAGLETGRIAVLPVYNQEEKMDDLHLIVESKTWRQHQLKNIEKTVFDYLNGHYPIRAENIHIVAPCTILRTSSGKTKRAQMVRLIQDGTIKKFQSRFVIHRIGAGFKNTILILRFIEKRLELKLFRRLKNSVQARNTNDPLMIKLMQIFSEVLNVKIDEDSVTKSFKDFKIDSVKVVELNLALNQHFGEIPLAQFIQFENLNEVRTYLKTSHSHNDKEYLYGTNDANNFSASPR